VNIVQLLENSQFPRDSLKYRTSEIITCVCVILTLRYAVAGMNACHINLSSRQYDTYSLASLCKSQILPHLSNMLVAGTRLSGEIPNFVLFFKRCLCDQIKYGEMADCVICMSKIEIHTNVYSKNFKFQDHLEHVDVN